MHSIVREAESADVALLVELMQRAHADAGFALDRELARVTFCALLSDRNSGIAWVALRDQKPEGYIVVTLKLSMESGGRDAFIDDLFVCQNARRKGVGCALVSAAFTECRRIGVCCVHVETGIDDQGAQAFYARCGLKNRGHTLLTRTLGDNPIARRMERQA